MKKVYLVIIFVLILLMVHTSLAINKYNMDDDSEYFSKLEKLNIGGIDQYVRIIGSNEENPIILFLHGGPGFTMMPFFEKERSILDHFTIVHWDQRGAGLSYNEKINKDTMTLNQITLDARELTKWIKENYQVDKVILIGHSFGSIIGIELIDKYPEDYLAYVGVGQVVDFVKNEKLSYWYALSKALKNGDSEIVGELKSVGKPDDYGEYEDENGYDITSKYVEYYGGDIYGENNIDQLYEIIFNSSIYKNNQNDLLEGYEFSQLYFDDISIRNLDLIKSHNKFDVPVIFIQGSNDYDTPTELVKMYYEEIKSEKKMYIIDKTSHFPFYEKAEEFTKILVEELINK